MTYYASDVRSNQHHRSRSPARILKELRGAGWPSSKIILTFQSFDAARAIFREFQRYPSYRLFVACEEGESAVVGSYALLLMHNLAHRGARSAIAEDVVVAADRQGRGIGRRLMAHALAETRAAGGYKLALSSNRRRTAAHAFYRSLGFVQHGLSFVVEA